MRRSFGAVVQLLNFFLSALRPDDLQVLAAGLVEVSLSPGQVLFEPGDVVDALYFPGSSTVGRESAVGLTDAVVNQPARSRIFAQIGGSAMRLSAPSYRARFRESADLTKLTLLHIRATALQAEQGVACNASHGVEQRLARWLLMTQDRVGADVFALTQE
jgi:CRP-like cAMP-binding protein